MAHETSVVPFDDILRSAIQSAIQRRLLEEVDPAIDRMIAEHRDRILRAHENAIAEIVVQLMAWASFERIGPDLRITLHNKFAKADEINKPTV